ncbi:MAG: hypothetical protein HYU41_08410 [Candidatus Rokubacteria bacterium]|nr:hypothetical protein [Candidatus Rokubacteria bacterium]
MAKRRNYGFERRQKETLRQARQAAKRDRKTERDAEGQSGPEMGAPEESGPPPGQWEWFSPSRGRVVQTNAGQRPDEAPDDWILLTDNAEESDATDRDS